MTSSVKKLGLVLFLILSTNFIFGQQNCDDAKLLGDWLQVDNFPFEENMKLDSLIRKIDSSAYTMIIWSFNDNGTYDLKREKKNVNGHYNFLPGICEIRLGQKKKTPEGLKFHILFIDDKHLIMKCTKPKGDFVYLHKRK